MEQCKYFLIMREIEISMPLCSTLCPYVQPSHISQWTWIQTTYMNFVSSVLKQLWKGKLWNSKCCLKKEIHTKLSGLYFARQHIRSWNNVVGGEGNGCRHDWIFLSYVPSHQKADWNHCQIECAVWKKIWLSSLADHFIHLKEMMPLDRA